MRTAIFIVLTLCFAGSAQATIPWPMEPFDSAQPLGNSYGEYQDYGGSPYMHPGIDILRPAGTAVYAVKAGWVKAVLTTSAELHWRVAIGDSAGADSCDGWLYAHLDEPTIAVSLGQHVDSGTFLGNIVQWPVADFHHLHFVKIRDAGLVWTANWRFVGNPLDELVNIDDFAPPFFVDINSGTPFRFCRDNSDTYFNVGVPINGDVDIIAKAHDRVGHPTWVLCPYEMGYEIRSDSVMLGPFLSFRFSGELLWDQSQHTVFKNSGPCNSQADYDFRQFYEILTNHDNDPLITPYDIGGKWATGQVPNDTYTIRAWAKDRYGNLAVDSMTVTTANFYTITLNLATTDGNPHARDFIVQVPYTGINDTTETCTPSYTSQPAGRYLVAVARNGYVAQSSIRDVFGNLVEDITLAPAAFINGDVDFNGIVNVSDAVYLINYIFAGGPYPVPWAAAVAIDASPNVSISDVVFLINYIFAGGPAPGAQK